MKVLYQDVIDAEKKSLFNWSAIWNYRELFYFFTWRDIKIKYKQTVLGFLWAVLQPLLMMVILTYGFGRILQVDSGDIKYPIFVLSGLLIWNAFSSGLSGASNSMINNATIIKKIYFPRMIIPVSAILGAVFDFFMAFLVFIPLLIFYGQPVAVNALWYWPLSLVLCILATAGPGCLLAALNVKYRDFRYVIPFVIQVLFFLSPIIYPISMLENPTLRLFVVISPLYAAIEFFRLPLGSIPPHGFDIIISLTSTIIFLLVGMSYFKRTEDFFADFA
jgi:lipopolysaccharide transport system permease protein